MKVFNRILALLAFSVVFVTAANAQSLTAPISSNQTLEAELVNPPAQSQVPNIDIYTIPGTGKIHVRVENYRPSSQIMIGIYNSSNRLIRQEVGAICTICGTFDIDIDEELAQGVYRVVVNTDQQMVSRSLYVK